MPRRNLRALFRLLDEYPRVIRVVQTSYHVEVQLSPVGPPVAVSAAAVENKKEPEEDPTPDEWIRRQYLHPDGT